MTATIRALGGRDVSRHIVTAEVTVEDGVMYLVWPEGTDYSVPIRVLAKSVTELKGWSDLDGQAIDLDNGWALPLGTAIEIGLTPWRGTP